MKNQEKLKGYAPFIIAGILFGIVAGTIAYKVVSHYGQQVENELIRKQKEQIK